MRTRLALFLLAGLLVYGCVHQAEESHSPRRSEFVEFVSANLTHDNQTSTAEDRQPAAHIVKLKDKACPADLLVQGEDFVRFVNASGDSVSITGLDSPGRSIDGVTVGVGRLSKYKSHIDLSGLQTDENGRPKSQKAANMASGSFEVNPNPYKDRALVFTYNVTYYSRVRVGAEVTWQSTSCLPATMGLWSVPPTMIVGPDTL